jgi:hypothetical protein
MAFISQNFARILRESFAATPEQIAEARTAEARRAMEERVRYEALSPQERAEYDALTAGMMPRAVGR